MAAVKDEKARFDTRLSKEQKQYFERAAQLGGFRNLTDFVLMAAQQRAKEIIEENEKIIASKRDSEIFFDAIMTPQKPNNHLQTAAEAYKALISK